MIGANRTSKPYQQANRKGITTMCRFVCIVSYCKVRFIGADGRVQEVPAKSHEARFASRDMAERHACKVRKEPGARATVFDTTAPRNPFARVHLDRRVA